MRRSVVSVFLQFAALLFPALAGAQTTPETFELYGVVLYPSRSPVAGARIGATAVDRSRTVTAQSDERGRFTIVVDAREQIVSA